MSTILKDFFEKNDVAKDPKEFLKKLKKISYEQAIKYIILNEKVRNKKENQEFKLIRKDFLFASKYFNDFCLEFFKDEFYNFNHKYIQNITNKYVLKEDTIEIDGLVIKKPYFYKILDNIVKKDDHLYGIAFIMFFEKDILFESYIYDLFKFINSL